MRDEAQWSLRAMTDADIPAIACAEVELFGGEAWSAQLLSNELHGPGSELKTYCVLYSPLEPEVIAGYAGVFCADVADVLTIATLPGFRRRGGGVRLLRHLIDVAVRAQCSEMLLEVRVSNEAAIALYEREGFLPVSVRKNYYMAPVEDAVMMRRILREGAHRPVGV